MDGKNVSKIKKASGASNFHTQTLVQKFKHAELIQIRKKGRESFPTYMRKGERLQKLLICIVEKMGQNARAE